MPVNNDIANKSTKDRIFHSAARLFAEYGYDNVSIRDLAKDVGIKNPSIYNHFSSKKEILTELYKFYSKQRKSNLPNIEELMKRTETMPPYEVLLSLENQFPEDVEVIRRQILKIAARLISTNQESWQFIVDNVLIASKELPMLVLKRLMELKKIEPFDIDAFYRIITYYCFGSIAMLGTPHEMSDEEWGKGIFFLYSSFIKPTGIQKESI